MSNIIDFSSHSEDKDRIKELARTYFSRNPRLVKSFVRDLAFLLRVIQPRYDYLSKIEKPTPQIEQEKKNLEEILRNPGLLAKIIVIREKFPSEFVAIQKEPTIISTMEENPGFDINTLKVEEENRDGSKKTFNTDLKILINSWPQFKLRETNPANFVLLGGSSGTEFHAEIDVGQFLNYANTGDIENFYISISKSPSYKRAEYLTSVDDAYNSASDDANKANIAKSILGALHLIEDINDRNKLLKSAINMAEKDSGAIFTQMTTEHIQRWIKGVEGSDKEDDQLNKIITSTPYGNSDESLRDRFWEAFTMPSLTERVIARFAIFISSLLNDSSFTNKQLILDFLNRGDFPARVARTAESINIGNNISTHVISVLYSDEKIKAINLIEQICPDDNNKKLLLEHLMNWAISTDENQKNFAKEHLLKTNLWPTDRDILVNIVQGFKTFYKTLDQSEQNNYQSLVIFFKGKEVWNGKRKRKTSAK